MNRGTRSGVRAVLARWRGRDIELKSPGEIQAMREAGGVVARALALTGDAARPGVSTGELDAMAEQAIRGRRGDPLLHGLPRVPGDDVHVDERGDLHGIPHPWRRSSRTATSSPSTAGRSWTGGTGRRDHARRGHRRARRPGAVGGVPRQALDAGIAAAGPDARLTDVSHAVQAAAEAAGAPRRRALRHRRGVRRARHRHLHAHGPVPAQPRRPRARSAAARRAWRWPSSRC